MFPNNIADIDAIEINGNFVSYFDKDDNLLYFESAYDSPFANNTKDIEYLSKLRSSDYNVYESLIIDDSDINYNLDLFEKGKIDKLFITGHSGSGKSSLAAMLSKKYHATHIELDDFLHPWKFSDKELKEYDKNIYKFFTSTDIGKEYRESKDKPKNVSILMPEFIKWIVKQDGRYIIEGIYLMFYIVDGDKFPKDFFDDKAFVLKGTSAIKSAIRQVNRDIKSDEDKGYEVSLKDTLSMYIKMIKYRLQNTKEYNKTKKDILTLIKESTEDIVLEAVKPETKIMLDFIYPKVSSVLSTSKGDRDFKNCVAKYIDRNYSKLHTVGPQYLIPFTDQVKQEFFDIFGINKKEICDKIKTVTKSISNSSNFIYLNNNPIFFVFYNCIRYYQLKKDEKGVNTSLIIYALSVYPSVFSNSFKYPPNAQVMQYTIDHLSEKFLIRKSGDLFGMLFTSIQHSYDFLKDSMKVATDGEMIRFIQRIRNDQKSLIKNICDEYMINHKKGLRTSTTKDSNLMNNEDIANMDIEKDNDSSVVETVTNKVVVPIITSGVNLQIVSQAKDIAGISLSDCRYYMGKILTDKYIDDIRKFIQAILFRYMYDERKTEQDINSQYFLTWASKLFRQTNSKNENIKTIKDTLSKWADETGIYSKFTREASRVNYKKAIFFYFIIAIQYYNR